jgi:hypothetical protein
MSIEFAPTKRYPGTQPENWRERTVQPRCSTCGQFARWNEAEQQWTTACVSYDPEYGYEHD